MKLAVVMCALTLVLASVLTGAQGFQIVESVVSSNPVTLGQPFKLKCRSGQIFKSVSP
jgi:hypothetical protein